MSKSTIFVGVLAVGALTAAGGSAFYTYQMTKPPTAVNANLGTFDLTEVAGYTVAEKDTALELSHELKGGNTSFLWEMAKNKPGDRMEFDGTWSVLTGGLVYNVDEKALKALEVVIAVDSVTGYGTTHPAPTTLTETLRGKTIGMGAWFDIDNHPEATFAASEILAKDALTSEDAEVFENAPDNWTHLIKGSFDLNGKTIDLSIPAAVEFIGSDVIVDLAFQINRSDFGIDGTIVGGWDVEDTANLTASVASAPKGDALLAALQQQAEAISGNGAQIKELYKLQNQVADLQSQITTLTELIEKLKTAGVSTQPEVDIANLPKTYTDSISYPDKDPIEFDMVLVPGDDDVAPFYMAKHEVTWEMFYNWAYGSDIDANQYAQLQTKNLRPSPLYEDCNQLKLGLGKRPALSMSRTTAEAFAKWVSEQTGKTYRVPTDAEWNHALKLGGGVPDSQEALFKQAVFVDNAEFQIDPPFLELTDVVGTKEANALGIHDMLGNAAEWVTDTGADRIVRGGHFLLKYENFNPDWKGVEDQDVWNETYPQLPVSKFWYRDHYYQGIRLIAEVE
jgi:formylglycine-generating enzyme required for sulfatase activity/polyisoprenoid-binding protein YceI